jgi:Fe-coproporphyrin III synthase
MLESPAHQRYTRVSAEPIQVGSPIRRLPLATLYLTERCNSRCVTCDYWRHGRVDLSLESVRGLIPSFLRLQTRLVLVSGGEPLLNPQWAAIAELLKRHGLDLWLLTSGLSLAKHAGSVNRLFDAVTVSLDGTNAATYLATRGLDAFDKVCEGIRTVADLGALVSVRVTLQRANYRELPEFVRLSRRLGAHEVSFLAVDVANPHAFGRADSFTSDLALSPDDLSILDGILHSMESEFAKEFGSGFIAESPQKLRHIHQYFSAVQGLASYPPVRCNAPEFSAVIDAKGRTHPCFFIPGPAQGELSGKSSSGDALNEALNGSAMSQLRAAIRCGERPECATCVCSMWRDLEAPGSSILAGQRTQSRERGVTRGA